MINYFAVLGAAVAAFIAGMLWHGPLFGKTWMKLMKFTPKDMKKMKLTPAQAMSMAFVMQLVVASVLSYFISVLNVTTLAAGTQLALLLWLGFSAPLLLGGFLWEGKTFKLWLFNASYRLVELIVMTGILSVWR